MKLFFSHSLNFGSKLYLFLGERSLLKEWWAKVLGTCFLGYGAGLVWFVISLPSLGDTLPLKTDGIVVLTGGEDRIETAFKLMQNHQAEKLLIAGVNPRTRLQDILKSASEAVEKNLAAKNHIDLDDRSVNTASNAREAAQWVRRHDLRSIRLVTAHYHMRRAFLEFSQALPDVFIVKHPVIPPFFQRTSWGGNFSRFLLIWREYNKYIGAFSRSLWTVIQPTLHLGAS